MSVIYVFKLKQIPTLKRSKVQVERKIEQEREGKQEGREDTEKL